MASEAIQKSELNVCCYCLNDSNKHDKYYFLSDKTEVYENMVRETFNIQICYLNYYDKMICLKCADDIQKAMEAKKRILEVQEKLMNQSEKFHESGYDSFKQEIESSCDECELEDSGRDVDKIKGVGTGCEDVDEATLKTEPKVTANGTTDSKETIIKIESTDADSRTPHRRRRKTISESISTKIKKLPIRRTETSKHVAQKNNGRRIGKKNSKSNPQKSRSYSESLEYMKINTYKLLNNSNMLLFISKRTKFACYSCKQEYFDIRQLREHSLSHSLKNNIRKDLNRCRGLSYKNVDISNLICSKCLTPSRDLNDLREHLKNNHGEVFENAEHLLVPFKLEEGFKCVICQATFFTFCRLSIHMNCHSTSNVCEICGVAYTNRQSLRNHISSTHTKKKCTQCSSVFPTNSAKARHLRKDHNIGSYKRYCLKCEMTFHYTYQLSEHMIEKHGAKRQIGSCEFCSKVFPSMAAVKVHIRAVHVGERNYPCSICDTRFFTSYDKKRHERTHGDEKSFSCSLCEVKFKTKDSVRRHLRKQHPMT